MWPSLVGLLLAFPPVTEPANIVAHHFGTPLAGPTEVSVATTGGGAWAFWVDGRRDRSFGVEDGARDDLWVARIGADGNLVGTLPRVGCLAPPGFTFTKPRAVSLGDGTVLVAWVARKRPTSEPGIFVAPMDVDGGLACPTAPLYLPGTLVDLELGSNGVSALLAWSNASQIEVRELTARGQPRGGGIVQELVPGGGGKPAVAGTDGGYIVSWVASDAGVLSQNLPGAGQLVTGPGTAVALVARQQGTAQGFIKGTALVARDLPSTGPAGGSALAISSATGMLLAPWDADALLAFGWSAPSDTRWSIGVPGMTFQAAQPFVSGYQPRAATAFNRGALAVAQQFDAGTAPLAAFVLGSTGVPAWAGGSLLSNSANQWGPSLAWANGWWMVGHDESDGPELAEPEFHQWRLDPDGSLSEAIWFDIAPTRYLRLVEGGGRVALLGTLNGKASLTELSHVDDTYNPGATLATANEALRFAALGPNDALQWSAGNGSSFTAVHTVAGSPVARQYPGLPGLPGRCAAVVDRTIYLPAWSGTVLGLMPFEGTSSTIPSALRLREAQQTGQPACAAANGTRVLVAWSNGQGLSAAIFDANTSLVVDAMLPATDSGDVEPVVTAAEGGWVLAWEARNTDTGRSTIHGTFVALNGDRELEVTKLGLDTVHSELRPALSSSPKGQVALAWSTFDEVSGQTTTQVRVIGTLPERVDGGSPTNDGGLTLPDGGSGVGQEGLVTFASCGCAATSPSSLWAVAAILFSWRRRPGRAP